MWRQKTVGGLSSDNGAIPYRGSRLPHSDNLDHQFITPSNEPSSQEMHLNFEDTDFKRRSEMVKSQVLESRLLTFLKLRFGIATRLGFLKLSSFGQEKITIITSIVYALIREMPSIKNLTAR